MKKVVSKGDKLSWLLDLWDPDRQRPKELSPAAQKRREKVLEQKQEITARVSESSRAIAFGTLASGYALLIAQEKLVSLFHPVRQGLLVAALMALITIVLDALQYLFAYINVQQALAHPQQGYPKNWSRNGRQACFLFKQLFAYLAGLLLIGSITEILVTA